MYYPGKIENNIVILETNEMSLLSVPFKLI